MRHIVPRRQILRRNHMSQLIRLDRERQQKEWRNQRQLAAEDQSGQPFADVVVCHELVWLEVTL
jgi:hypothetical protein